MTTQPESASKWVERASLFHALACEYAEEKDEERSAHWTAVHHSLLVEQAALTERLAKALECALDDSQSAIDQHLECYGETYRPERLKYMRDQLANASAALAAYKESK